MQTSRYLWLTGSVVFGLLGLLHLILTFFTDKFLPADKTLLPRLQETSPLLSDDISFWKAWVGFNASHSIGILFIAIINGYIASRFFSSVERSDFFFLLNLVVVGSYIFLALKYWFMPPLIGTGITFLCYAAAYALVKIFPTEPPGMLSQ